MMLKESLPNLLPPNVIEKCSIHNRLIICGPPHVYTVFVNEFQHSVRSVRCIIALHLLCKTSASKTTFSQCMGTGTPTLANPPNE